MEEIPNRKPQPGWAAFCGWGSPVMPRIRNLTRHCETTKSNSECPYACVGCRGCWPQYCAVIGEENLERAFSAVVEEAKALHLAFIHTEGVGQ